MFHRGSSAGAHGHALVLSATSTQLNSQEWASSEAMQASLADVVERELSDIHPQYHSHELVLFVPVPSYLNSHDVATGPSPPGINYSKSQQSTQQHKNQPYHADVVPIQ